MVHEEDRSQLELGIFQQRDTVFPTFKLVNVIELSSDERVEEHNLLLHTFHVKKYTNIEYMQLFISY